MVLEQVTTPGRVRPIEVPPAARARSTLTRIDYEDAFLVETDHAQDRTAEQWVRAILEHGPTPMRRALRRAWLALGLRLGSTRSERLVLGWEVRRSRPEFALLGAGSRIGLPAEVLLERQQHTLLLATFVQHENRIARALWKRVAPGHRRVVRYVLEHRTRVRPAR